MKPWQSIAIGTAVLAAAGYVYLHGGLSWLEPKSQIASTGDLSGTAGRPAAIDWQTVNRPDDGFKIEMPVGAKDLQVPAFNEAGSMEPVKMIFSNPDADTTYAISWEDNPPVARVNNRVPDRTLDMARDGMLARTRTTLTHETQGTVGDYPARDIFAKNAGGGVLNARLIYTGDRLYTLMALFPSSGARREQDVQRFFQSFTPSQMPGKTLPRAD